MGFTQWWAQWPWPLSINISYPSPQLLVQSLILANSSCLGYPEEVFRLSSWTWIWEDGRRVTIIWQLPGGSLTVKGSGVERIFRELSFEPLITLYLKITPVRGLFSFSWTSKSCFFLCLCELDFSLKCSWQWVLTQCSNSLRTWPCKLAVCSFQWDPPFKCFPFLSPGLPYCSLSPQGPPWNK